MLIANIPAKISTPFGDSGGRTTIPVPSQIGITAGAASFTDGFPPLTRTPPASGGIPPSGLDMNGILWELSSQDRWTAAGGLPKYDFTFCTAIGGYPLDAVVQSADGTGYWRNTTDGNTTNPDTGGAGWVPHFSYGSSSITLSGSNVTLSAVQASRPQLLLTGVLTTNVNLILPTNLGQWLVTNDCSGAYTVTAKTAGGTGVALIAGPNLIYGDGTNIYSSIASYVPSSQFSGTNQSLGLSGYQKLPGGLILQWGTVTVPAGANVESASFSFPITFPNGIFHLSGNVDHVASGTWTGIMVVFPYSSWSTAGATATCDTGNVGQAIGSSVNVRWFALGN